MFNAKFKCSSQNSTIFNNKLPSKQFIQNILQPVAKALISNHVYVCNHIFYPEVYSFVNEGNVEESLSLSLFFCEKNHRH